MPPNPLRQEKMAARRLQMENDPKLQEMQRDVSERYLSGTKSPEVEAVKPRQMLPNYYAKGGKVARYCKGGKVLSSKNY